MLIEKGMNLQKDIVKAVHKWHMEKVGEDERESLSYQWVTKLLDFIMCCTIIIIIIIIIAFQFH
jgi:hypothetical protein